MALTIDFANVLRGVADHPDAFPAARPDLTEIARRLLVKELKAKTTHLEALQKIQTVVGRDNVSLILDEFRGAELTGLLKRIDPHHAPFDPSDLAALRAHIIALGASEAKTAPLAVKPAKARPKAPKPVLKDDLDIGSLLNSKVHSGIVRPKRPRKTGAS